MVRPAPCTQFHRECLLSPLLPSPCHRLCCGRFSPCSAISPSNCPVNDCPTGELAMPYDSKHSDTRNLVAEMLAPMLKKTLFVAISRVAAAEGEIEQFITDHL